MLFLLVAVCVFKMRLKKFSHQFVSSSYKQHKNLLHYDAFICTHWINHVYVCVRHLMQYWKEEGEGPSVCSTASPHTVTTTWSVKNCIVPPLLLNEADCIIVSFTHRFIALPDWDDRPISAAAATAAASTAAERQFVGGGSRKLVVYNFPPHWIIFKLNLK